MGRCFGNERAPVVCLPVGGRLWGGGGFGERGGGVGGLGIGPNDGVAVVSLARMDELPSGA